MVIARRPPTNSPTSDAAAEPDTPAGDQVLMEQLLRKSLAVNPALKDGKSTSEVISDLRKAAVAMSKTGGAMPGQARPGAAAGASKPGPAAAGAGAGGAATPGQSMTERRHQTIVYFFDQRSQDFERQHAELQAQERALQERRLALRAEFLDSMADFFSLMHGGAESPEARAVFRKYASFLSALGVSEADIVRRTREKAGS